MKQRSSCRLIRTSRRPADGGQLLLLAGIILVLGFITTALTLSQIGHMEKDLSEGQQTPLLTEYRFFRTRVGTSLFDATTASTDNSTFLAIFQSMSDTFRRMAQEKGYDFEVTLAAHGLGLERTEWSYTSWGWPDRANDGDPWYNVDGTPVESGTTPSWASDRNPYWLNSYDGRVDMHFEGGPVYWDDEDDGLVWVDDCEIAPGAECLQAVIVFLRMADNSASITEYVVYPLNAT